MIENAVKEIRSIVNGFNGLVPDSQIQSIFVQLGIIEAYHRGSRQSHVKRIPFPKTFSIKTTDDNIKMHEVTPNCDIFCCEDTYDIVVQSVIEMQSRRENFNRFSLLDETRKEESRVTMPALLVCFHYWLSVDTPLLKKQDDGLFSIDVDDFELAANAAWDDLNGTELVVGKPS